MDYKKINEKLGNLEELRNSLKPVHRKVNYEINSEYDGEQGASNDIDEVYDIGLSEGLFIKLNIGSNSYGYDEFVKGIEFVKAVEKTIKVYKYEE